MKRFTAIALAALMVLSFVSVASAADSVEIRSPVFNGTDFSDIDRDTIDYTDFAGFFYDIDDGIGSEKITILTNSSTRTIGEDELIYTTDIQEVGYAYDGWDGETFDKMGFLAEEFVPVNGEPALLSKLILDDDEKYTMRVGQTLDLGEGFALTPKQIDVDGEKVWLELTKDGEFLDDDVFSTVNNVDNSSWDYEADIEDEDDVVVMRVHVNEVFQGQVDSLAIIEGIWLMNDEAMEIENEDTFGDLEVTDTSNGDAGVGLTLKNVDNTITLGADDTIDITDSLKIQVADSDDLRFFFFEEITEPGTYQIRGTVAEGDATHMWDAASFAGFYYDIDDNVASEKLEITVAGRSVAEDTGVVYTTDIQEVGYAYDGWAGETFDKMGFLAEEYVPVNGEPALLSKLILDDDEKYTMRVGQTLDLGEGFALTPKQIDVDGEKVWLELTKDGEFLDDDVFSTVNNVDNSSWDYEADIEDEDDVVVMRVHVNEVFQGQVDSLAIIEGIWLMNDEAMEIENEDTFGDLEVTDTSNGDAGAGLTLKNMDNSITLGADDTIDLTDTMKLQVADSDTVRFYPFVEVTVGEGVVEEPVDEVEEPVDEVEEPVDENVTEPVDENVTEPVDEVEEEEEEEEEPVPGFEAVFAIAGLLAVAYFVRRN
ncbi:S-layer protein domain-containing protein [Methanococcoides methylutens]|uniref:S-layer protein domain-containing protein n=1 Tax=Methanococcoides methylutens TaxID=2226 RepID=UPI004043DB1A